MLRPSAFATFGLALFNISRGHTAREALALGGWKSIRSRVECYAQFDRETMRAVVNEPRKLFATDLEPSQLATREAWSPPRGESTCQRSSGDERRAHMPAATITPPGLATEFVHLDIKPVFRLRPCH